MELLLFKLPNIILLYSFGSLKNRVFCNVVVLMRYKINFLLSLLQIKYALKINIIIVINKIIEK